MKKLVILFITVIMLMAFTLSVNAKDNPYKLGDIIQFGLYPQSQVKDETLTAKLDALAPTWDNWTSYGYYSGTNNFGTMVQGDWMRYIDINYDGNKYRGVKFTQYRSQYTPYDSSTAYTCQDDNGYSTNVVYWFIFESIDWRVLDPETGLVMCETIIDSQSYSNTIYSNGGGTYGCFNDASYMNYASDYETSSIRKWLNNDFYNTAFTDSEKKEIGTTTLNNDGYYTSVGTTGYEALDSNETKDKIFLLSYNEVRNSNFGFNSDEFEIDTARQAQGSDYAQSQGLYVNRSSVSTYNGNSYWLLRSPGYYSFDCCTVDYYGCSNYIYSVLFADFGVRPALRFNRISNIAQSEHQHNYNLVEIAPTCISAGTKTYTCSCGDTYTETIAKLSHKNETQTTKATLTKNGGYKVICKNCGQISGEGVYYSPEIIELKTTKYTYDGKAKKPAVLIEDKMGVDLKEGTDYKLTYESGRKNPGKYSVKITFMGNYSGTKTLYFTILPGKTSKITATQSTSAIKLTWKKVTGADGYRVYQYNSKNGKYEKIKTLTGTSYTVKKLKAGTTYKFAVKAYTKDNGETLWAASSVSIKTATKPATPTVKATANNNKVTLKWSKVTGATGYVVYMQDEFGDYEKLGSTKKTSYTRKKLTKGKTYYFRVRAYKTVDGKNIYGGYKTVKVKVK